jgi:hypothetical protein
VPGQKNEKNGLRVFRVFRGKTENNKSVQNPWENAKITG